MARIFSLIALLFLSTVVFAAEDDWYKDWWNNVYELRIKQQQIDDLTKTRDEKCPEKIQRYEQKLREDPKSEYYRFKLEEWRKKCFIR